MSRELIQLDPADNVAVAARDIAEGERLSVGGVSFIANAAVSIGHKLALRDIAAGEAILKYGAPIGVATRAARCGDHMHDHNIASLYAPVPKHVEPGVSST